MCIRDRLIAEHIDGLSAEEIHGMLEVPQASNMGDYAFPCFKLAKTLRKAPPLIAADIAAKIEGSQDVYKRQLIIQADAQG